MTLCTVSDLSLHEKQLFHLVLVIAMQIGHLQDALQELRDSIKVSLQDAATERESYETQAAAKALADKTLYEVGLSETC